MDPLVVGLVGVGVALGALLGLIVWSRRTIERIHRRHLTSLRQIQRRGENGK